MVVAFATLILGLVVGVRPVELVVGDGVARVELLLDGEVVGEAGAAPWRVSVDFGAELEPHELVALARGSGGEELARVRQWINVPRAPAEATAVLEDGGDGAAAVARVAWGSVMREEPRRVTATFDGEPLPVADPRRIELPPHDPARLHLLRVDLEFSANLGAVAELVFGGGYGSDTATTLTAVPVALESRRRELTAAALAGRLLKGGAPLRVVAVEEGPAEVVLVMDRQAQAPLLELGRRWAAATAGAVGQSRGGEPSRRRPDAWNVHEQRLGDLPLLRYSMRLGEGQSARFLWPFGRSGDHERVRYDAFARSEDHPPTDGGLLWLLTAAQQPAFPPEAQRLADAVAVAGMSAAARGRRRAVILVLGESPRDASQFEPATVRRYLSDLGVPLFVWSVGEASGELEASWGEVRSVRRERWFRDAVKGVSSALDAQRIVWVDGLHLPQEVSLSAGAKGLRMVR